MQKTQSKEKGRVRYKEYKCTFPGCNEGLKTKYNCISHIWDIHLRHLNNTTESFKHVANKEEIKELCLPHLKYVMNSESERKRRPYDLGDLINSPEDQFQNGQLSTATPSVKQQSSECTPQQLSETYSGHCTDNNSLNAPQSYSSQQPTSPNYSTSAPMQQCNQQDVQQINSLQNINYSQQFDVQPNCLNQNYNPVDMYSNGIVTDDITCVLSPEMQNQIQVSENQQPPNQITLNPITYQLLNSGNEDFIQIYHINQNIKRLHVFGEVFAENGFLQRSDRRYKRDIRKISDALKTILMVSGKSYRYLNDDKKRFGFIAQELKEVIPEAVKEDEDGSLSIDPLALLPFIVESLKELSSQLDDLNGDTSMIKKFKGNVNQALSEVETINCDDKWSLGPKSFVFYGAITLSISSILIALNGNFPFIWAYLTFCSGCFWLSHQLSPKGTWNSYSVSLNFILLNIGLACVATTFLMGSVLQVYLGIYISLMLLLWGGSQTIKTSFVNFFIVSFSFCCIACWIVFMFQPTFTCDVRTPMTPNSDFPEYLEYNSPEDIRFELTSDIPWNCIDPHLEVRGRHTQFESKDNPLVVYGNPTDFPTGDKVEVKLACSNVEYKCSEYYIAKVKKELCIFF
ncbi:Peptidase S74 domain-containing protein [Entamoeba marina]